MKSIELLTAIGEVKNEYVQDIFFPIQTTQNNTSSMKSHGNAKKSVRRSLLIAAIIALIALLVGCTVAMRKLQHLAVPYDNSFIMSPQGYIGSPSYEAFREWQEFLDGYDIESAISEDFQVPEEYWSYRCYNQEMIDKIDEICEKYGLKLLGNAWSYNTAEEIYACVGIDSIFTTDMKAKHPYLSGYCYPDGTFCLEGNIQLTGEWEETLSFDYRSVMKTSFDDVPRGLGEIADHDQWNYTMKDGTQALLAIREGGALIAVDKEDYFVTVGILGVYANGQFDYDLPTTARAFLESICDIFDFSYHPQPVDETEAEVRYQNQQEKPNPDSPVNPSQIDSFSEYIDYLVNVEKYTDLYYALMDVNNDGIQELLLQCKNYQDYNYDKNSFFQLFTLRNGIIQPVYRCGSGNLYLCEENVLEYEFVFEGWETSYGYYSIDSIASKKMDYIIVLTYYDQDMQWRRKDLEFNETEVVISSDEATAIREKYPRIDIIFNPISEFTQS